MYDFSIPPWYHQTFQNELIGAIQTTFVIEDSLSAYIYYRYIKLVNVLKQYAFPPIINHYGCTAFDRIFHLKHISIR